MRRPAGPFPLASLFLILATSCGGLTASPSGADAGPATSGSSGSGTSSSDGGTGSGGGSGSSSGASSGSGGSSGGTAYDGGPCPNVDLSTIQDVNAGAAAVAGRWAACERVENLHMFGNNPADTVGLEFGPATSGGGGCAAGGSPCLGGDLYLLVQGPNGLERGQGIDYHIYYALTPGFLWLYEMPTNGSWSTAYSASSNPRVLDVQSTGYNSGTILVGIP
jgi:hypothetical protein